MNTQIPPPGAGSREGSAASGAICRWRRNRRRSTRAMPTIRSGRNASSSASRRPAITPAAAAAHPRLADQLRVQLDRQLRPGQRIFLPLAVLRRRAEALPDAEFRLPRRRRRLGVRALQHSVRILGEAQRRALRENLDPAKLDIDLLVDMFEKYGNAYLTPERIRAEPHHSVNSLFAPDEQVGRLRRRPASRKPRTSATSSRPTSISAARPTTAERLAFNGRLNHFGAS